MRFLRVVLTWALVLLAPPAASQAGGAPTLRGVVRTPDGAPIAGADVVVTGADGATRTGRTTTQGTFAVVPGSASARFVVSVSAAGRVPVTRVVDESAPDLGALSFVLALRPVELDPLRVVSSRAHASAARRTPGSTGDPLTGLDLREQPLTGDLADLVALEGGGTHVGPGGLSMAGQAPDQTRTTLDGGSADGPELPREAARSVQALTNTYDVSRGGFTGGQLAVRTQRGTDAWGGGVRLSGSLPFLRYGDVAGAPGFRRGEGAIDAGGGGALVAGRLYAYGAVTLRYGSSPGRSLRALDSLALLRLGTDRPAVDRFLAAAGPLGLGGGAASGATSRSGVGLLRLDATLSPRHALTVRMTGDLSRSRTDADPVDLTGGDVLRGSGAGVMTQLTSGDAHLGNVLRLQLSGGSTERAGAREGPSARVTVGPADAPAFGPAVQAGGYPGASANTRRRLVEVADELSLVTGDGRHRVVAGAEWSSRELRRRVGADLGTFEFRTLADFEAGRPSYFGRTLGERRDAITARRASLHVGDHWVTGGGQLTYGLRVERAWYPGAAADGAGVEAAFGHAPGRIPSSLRVSPRVGFSLPVQLPWDRATGSTTDLNGGIGEFVGTSPVAALGETGLEETASLACVGAAAPAPDWAAYADDPERSPAACRDGLPHLASRVPDVTLFLPGYAAPRAWRGSLSSAGRLPRGFFWRGAATVVRSASQPLASDANLGGPAFTLDDEGGRAVYVPVAAIDTASGSPGLEPSRRVPGFGVVREVRSNGRAGTVQLTANLNRMLGRARGGVAVDYTWTSAWEEQGAVDAPGRFGATAGASAEEVERVASGYAPRHVVQMHLRLRAWQRRLVVTARGRVGSGLPYTPRVAGDVNGDGRANDRAFVFDPAAAGDAATAEGMAALLAGAPDGARQCLRAQVGRIAAPGSCRGPWSATLDLTAELPLRRTRGGGNRASVWIAARNVTAGVDRLLHGEAGLRGWGQTAQPDATLLTVQRFDPVARRYAYAVNERFGSTAGSFHVPFSVRVEARVVLGKDPAWRDVLQDFQTGGQRTPAALRAHLSRTLVDVPREVLAANGPRRLDLTPDQATRLASMSDSLAARIATVSDALVALLSAPAGMPVVERRTRLEGLTAEARALLRAGVDGVRSTVSEAQWRRVPGALKDAPDEFTPLPPQQFSIAPTEW